MFISFDLLYIVNIFLTGYTVKFLAGSFPRPFFVVERHQILSVNNSSGQLSFALILSDMVTTEGLPIKKILGLRNAGITYHKLLPDFKAELYLLVQ